MTEKCEYCDGSGFKTYTVDSGNGTYHTEMSACICTYTKMLVSHIIRAYSGTKNVPMNYRVDSSPLSTLSTSAWITLNTSRALYKFFAGHILCAGLDRGLDWNFKVVTDAELMSAWLANAYKEGQKIYDNDSKHDFTDIGSETLKYVSLEDLVRPSEYLIVLSGVKRAPNKAMGAVFAETLQIREADNKKTWFVDSTYTPYDSFSLAWDPVAAGTLADYEKVVVEDITKNSKGDIVDRTAKKTTNGGWF
jgi:hypothetical protein